MQSVISIIFTLNNPRCKFNIIFQSQLYNLILIQNKSSLFLNNRLRIDVKYTTLNTTFCIILRIIFGLQK